MARKEPQSGRRPGRPETRRPGSGHQSGDARELDPIEFPAPADGAGDWFALGRAWEERDRLDRAADAYRRACEIDPQVATYHVHLGYVETSLGRLENAESAYREALRLAPNDDAAWFNLGNLLCELERHDDAASAYRRALAVRAEDHEAWNNLGNALSECGRLTEARAAYRASIALVPEYGPAWNNLGLALDQTSDLIEAERAFCRALDASPRRATYLVHRASVRARLGRHGEAREDLARAVREQPAVAAVLGDFAEFAPILDDGRSLREQE